MSLLSQAISAAKPALNIGGFKSALRTGLRSDKAPSLLASAIGAGAAGAVMGDQDFGSFGIGMAAGLAGGVLARRFGTKMLGHSIKQGAQMSMKNPKFNYSSMNRVPITRHLSHQKMMPTNNNTRRMLFAGGALLSGGAFSSMFAGNGNSYKHGLNANRGNSIVR